MYDQDNEQNTHSNEHQRRIDDWDILETIVDEERAAGKFDFSTEIVIERPVFEDGDTGYQRVLAIIQVGERFLRLNTKALTALLDILNENEVKILRAITSVNTANDNKRRQHYNQQQDDPRLEQGTFNSKPKRQRFQKKIIRDRNFGNE